LDIALRMSKMNLKVVISYLVGVALLSACGGVFVSSEGRAATQTAGAIDGIAAQTLEALRTADDPEMEPSPEPVATNTSLPATSTPLPTATPWPKPVRIQVSVDTNCRSGPGRSFPLIGALMVGETTIVHAQVSEIDYWIVENPDNPGRECWLWGRHATLDGDVDQLPLATPSWTATPEPATIAGWIFLDANNNGVRGDPGDASIGGVQLTLRVGACPGGSSVAEVETNSQGRFQISNLIPTLYCLSRDTSQQLIPNTWSILLSPGQFRDEVNFRRLP
jgi:hypothetical protein